MTETVHGTVAQETGGAGREKKTEHKPNAPHKLRGASVHDLWQRVPVPRAFLVDLGWVVSFAAIYLLTMFIGPHPPGTFWWWPTLVSIPVFGLLLLRRQLPWLGLVVMVGVVIAFSYAKLPVNPFNLAILVSVYSVCAKSELPGALAAPAFAMLWPIASLPLLSTGDGVLLIAASVVNLVMVVSWGLSIRTKDKHAGQLAQTVQLLDRARDQLAAEAATVERARIAREFHDIVSHNLSVVALRAGVARSLVERNPEHARETLQELERTSRSALDEMRNLLSGWRDTPGGEFGASELSPDELARQPAPGLHRVDALIESVKDTGVVWRLDRTGAARDLGSGVELTAFRIVQEAVTNVLKHANTGYARVLIDYQTSHVRIEVNNHATRQDVSTPAGAQTIGSRVGPSGNGLIGLRERVSLHGGTLTAHPIPNGFHLSAVLPCSEPSELV